MLADMRDLMLLQAQLSGASVLGAWRMGTGLIARGIGIDGHSTSPDRRAVKPDDDAEEATPVDDTAAMSPARSRIAH